MVWGYGMEYAFDRPNKLSSLNFQEKLWVFQAEKASIGKFVVW